MTVEELLKVKPITFGVYGLALKDGRNFVSALASVGVHIDFTLPFTIRMVQEELDKLDEAVKSKVLAWEIDENAQSEVFPTNLTPGVVDPTGDISLKHANSIYGWTTCIVTIMLVAAISYNIVLNHTYPRSLFIGIVLFPLTVALFRTLGVLRNRQSMLGVILGDGPAKETVLQSVINGAASAVVNRNK